METILNRVSRLLERSQLTFIALGVLVSLAVIIGTKLLADNVNVVQSSLLTERYSKDMTELRKAIGDIETEFKILQRRTEENWKSLNDEHMVLLHKYRDFRESLIKDENLRSAIVQAAAEAPTEGFLRTADFETRAKQTDEVLKGFRTELDRLVPLYNALDVNNKENVLAIPLIRKDINSISLEMEGLSKTLEKNSLALSGEIAAQTGRIYDLGKWFFGLLIAAIVFPMLEPFIKRHKTEKPEAEAGQRDKTQAARPDTIEGATNGSK